MDLQLIASTKNVTTYLILWHLWKPMWTKFLEVLLQSPGSKNTIKTLKITKLLFSPCQTAQSMSNISFRIRLLDMLLITCLLLDMLMISTFAITVTKTRKVIHILGTHKMELIDCHLAYRMILKKYTVTWEGRRTF